MVYGQDGYTGGCTRVGIPGEYQGGYTGYYPATACKVPMRNARSAGRGYWDRPQGSRCSAAGRLPGPPSGPGRSLQALPVLGPSECRLWAIRARFNLILLKVSQNDEVSPFFIEKACHSPCFQNGLHKSPLDFPRFPFSSAFSHKELMGQF